MLLCRPMPLSGFHPIIAGWFRERFGSPTDVQAQSWPAIRSGMDVLIAAPTGSGKTLAAFLSCIDGLFKHALTGGLEDRTHVLYVSPLKALSNDVQKNLRQPLAEIADAALAAGVLMPEVRAMVRTGDTSMVDRQRMLKCPPHILITTPESLYLLLTAEKSRKLLADVHTIIVDEIHAVAPNKRGTHLALSLERLETLTPARPVRIGLSATQRPIETVAQFLVGMRPPPRIIDIGHQREMDLAVEVTKDELGAVATNAIWSETYDRLAELVRAHRSTLVFVNTRRLAERVSHHLAERLQETLGMYAVAAHHGSLSRHIRLSAEERLKTGQTRVVVATASLELGIDVGAVDLVCQIGSPRAISVCLQRVGRSGHWIGAVPKGRLFATTRDELIECAALISAIRTGTLDRLEVPPAPLDILAQQIVAAAATQTWREQDLFDLVRRAYPYHRLDRKVFDAVVRMQADGIATGRGRGRAYLHLDRVNGRIRGRRGARLAAITSGGAIPDTANYAVIAEPDGTVVGSVDEDFAVESLAGDIILLGNASWKIRGVETGKMRVEDARGAPPTIPFWRGEAPSRTAELSAEVAAVRSIADRLLHSEGSVQAIHWLAEQCGLGHRGAEQAAAYLAAGRAVLGDVPTQETIIAERFFDEAGGMQLVLHTPFGGRINRAWGMALRKRFCTTFDFELQAAATDEGLVLSLGERHSFPLDTIFSFLRSDTVRDVLMQAIVAAPMFTSRWRWNASRALALLRFANGHRVPPQIQRMRAEDLLGAVFPAATACQDNHPEQRRDLPDHPLVEETIRDCLTEAMDLDGLIAVLQRIERKEIRCVAVEVPAPSPFCHEILNANPYAFLDDAPLEERRARAVAMRRSLPADLAGHLGALDEHAIARVAEESWPSVRDPDELHDALLTLVWIPERQGAAWGSFLPALLDARRAVVVHSSIADVKGWAAAERVSVLKAVFPDAELWPPIEPCSHELPYEAADAVVSIVQGWMESTGPTTADELAGRLHVAVEDVSAALLRLEASGQVLRGSFRGEGSQNVTEWCHRRLVARIHRLTIGRLRTEIEPVTAVDFMQFLFQWQHVTSSARLHGEAGLLEVIRQLAGFEAAASSWECRLFPMRLAQYDPVWLDRLCLTGSVMWGRLSPHPRTDCAQPDSDRRRIVPTSTAPISLFPREDGDWLLNAFGERHMTANNGAMMLSPEAQDLLHRLRQCGASFFADLVKGSGRRQPDIENGLWELASAGFVTADGFDNLRTLLDARGRRNDDRHFRRSSHGTGRWSVLRAPAVSPSSGNSNGTPSFPIEAVARQLLRRYGVVFRDLLRREPLNVGWRDLLIQYRRMELQGDIRGGRFVSGFTGEQFALPEAVESLRTLRRSRVQASPSAEIIISGADPLNLAGIILPGDRVPAVPTNSLVFRDGVLYPSCPMREPESVKNQKSSVTAPWVSTEASTSL